MLPYLTHTFHLPPALSYIIVLGALALGCLIVGSIFHHIVHRWARRLQGTRSEVAVELLESFALPLVVTGAFEIALEALSLPARYDRYAGRFILATNYLAHPKVLEYPHG
jgi:hypothetical protein